MATPPKTRDWDAHLRDEFQDIADEYVDRINTLTTQYREEVLLPLCRRLKVLFFAESGGYCFQHLKTDVIIETAIEAHQYDLAPLAPVFGVLNRKGLDGRLFGSDITDIDEDDIR